MGSEQLKTKLATVRNQARNFDYLSFGFGTHCCLGTNLARAELRASLKALLPILPRLELMPGATRIAHARVSAYATLPVRLRG